MGFTVWMALLYLVLIAGTIFAFMRKRKIIGIILITVMTVGIVILGYLWFISPM